MNMRETIEFGLNKIEFGLNNILAYFLERDAPLFGGYSFESAM